MQLPYNPAVRQHRRPAKQSLDYLPTPPWAVRALVHHLLGPDRLRGATVLEPACGAGDMARALAEFGALVQASDIADYGIRAIAGAPPAIADFLTPAPAPSTAPPQAPTPAPDWVITNPPFALAEAFVHRALSIAREGVAVIVRSAFAEGKGRYRRLYATTPPDIVATYAERVPMFVGHLDPKRSTATCYAVMLWFRNGYGGDTRQRWIPPCRDTFERPDDYHGWHWHMHAGRPIPHLTLPAALDAPQRLAQALPLIRPATSAVLHDNRRRTVASLLAPSPTTGRPQVLARIAAPTPPDHLSALLATHGIAQAVLPLAA